MLIFWPSSPGTVAVCSLDARLGQLQDFAEGLVHLDREIARHLDMLLLVAPHRHDVAVVNQNIGRHQDRIGEKSGRRGQAARDFVLVGMGAFQQSHRRDRAQDPGQLRHLRHIGLAEERGALRIESAGEEIERDPARFSRSAAGSRKLVRA